MDPAYRQDYPVTMGAGRCAVLFQRQALRQFAIMAVDGAQDGDERRHQDQYDPRAVAELSGGEDQRHDRRQDGAEAVEDHLALPPRFVLKRRADLLDLASRFQVADLPPTARHAGLRQGKGEEHADGVQRDQQRHAGLENDDQHARDQRQERDAA